MVFAPCCINAALEDGRVSQEIIDHYVKIAEGGVGLIIVEGTCVTQGLKIAPKCTALTSDEHMPGLEKLVRQLKRYRVKVAIQLVENLNWNELTITDLSRQEILQMINHFVSATDRAKRIGFDAVEYHACHGYTLSAFLSKYRNHRDDEFGKGFSGRMKVMEEIINGSKEKVGDRYPLICRMNGDEFLVGGNTPKDAGMIARRLEHIGVHAVDVSCGRFDEECKDVGKLSEGRTQQVGYSASRVALTDEWPDGANIHLAEFIKTSVHIPVIGGGKITHPHTAESILQQNKADLVFLGRPLLRDPFYPKKAAERRWDEIHQCIACNHCVHMLMENKRVVCRFSTDQEQ